MDELISQFRANPMPWLIVMFLGIFYWGFRSRWQHRQKSQNRDVNNN